MADQSKAGGFPTRGMYHVLCNVPKGDTHVLSIKSPREPSAFGGIPRPVASEGKKPVRFWWTKEGPRSMGTNALGYSTPSSRLERALALLRLRVTMMILPGFCLFFSITHTHQFSNVQLWHDCAETLP